MNGNTLRPRLLAWAAEIQSYTDAAKAAVDRHAERTEERKQAERFHLLTKSANDRRIELLRWVANDIDNLIAFAVWLDLEFSDIADGLERSRLELAAEWFSQDPSAEGAVLGREMYDDAYMHDDPRHMTLRELEAEANRQYQRDAL